eukprot:1829646-Rhodomonas_salina.1
MSHSQRGCRFAPPFQGVLTYVTLTERVSVCPPVYKIGTGLRPVCAPRGRAPACLRGACLPACKGRLPACGGHVCPPGGGVCPPAGHVCPPAGG